MDGRLRIKNGRCGGWDVTLPRKSYTIVFQRPQWYVVSGPPSLLLSDTKACDIGSESCRVYRPGRVLATFVPEWTLDMSRVFTGVIILRD